MKATPFKINQIFLYGLLMMLPISYWIFDYDINSFSLFSNTQKRQSSITIIADIGGTNSRFQLIEVDTTMIEPKIIYSKKYFSQEFETFSSLFQQFLSDSFSVSHTYPNNAVIAIAGPVRNNKVTPSNLKKWGELNGNDLVKEFSLQSCIFLNDFEAIGYSLLKIQKKEYIQINKGVLPLENEKIAVLGPGTGLGYCTLVPAPFHKGIRYYVWGGEGGHSAFSPINKEETEYMFWLM